ncbi:MAG: methyltransferase domain-containing protein [Patescibacteria group bacterium]
MNHPLLKYLCCPVCKLALVSKSKSLYCKKCKKEYSISNGIPILINLSTLPTHLQNQVKYFEKEDLSRGKYALEAWQKRYVDNFLMHTKLQKNSIVIDNATGSGYMAIELAKKGYDVIAMDLTFAELVKLKANILKLKLQKNVLLTCASSEELPIKAKSADGMVANAILEHLPHEKKAIKEIERVLKRKALLMLAMPIHLKYVWPFLWPVNILHDKKIGHLRRYTRKTILNGFSRFTELKTYYTGNLGKVFFLLCKIFTKNPRWDDLGERIDMYTEQIPFGASNVVSILQKK